MAGTPTELVSGIVTRYSSPKFRFDVWPRDSHLARGSVRRCVLASREWVPICLLSGFLGDTDDDARRDGGSCHVSADEFDRATWRARRTLLDRFSQRSNALTCSQLWPHLARLCGGGQPHPQSENPRRTWI